MSHKPQQVKNRAPAPIQITAEQILREAQARQEETFKPTARKITSAEELADYRMRKRKEFEDGIRRQRQHIGTWIKYAKWEESQREFTRSRSIFERVIDVDYTNPTIWRKYAEMEMKHKFVNHARNVWDRAVTYLPRVDQLWYKYSYMEEMLGNAEGCRNVFERWMRWEPEDQAWLTYIKFEQRQKEVERARKLYERYVICHPTAIAYIRYAKWEERAQQKPLARKIFERSLEELAEQEVTGEIYVEFAKFEERAHEHERARMIYKYALDRIPKAEAGDLYKEFITFEKQHGSRTGIDDVIVNKRRFQYEAQVKAEPQNYDIWFDWIRLEESAGDRERTRHVYERAIAQVPPVQEKKYWRRYIYLWINYALYEELEAKDVERTRAVYKACSEVVPHKAFTFAKIWTLWAHFEVRQKDLNAARRILGNAIGRCAKDRIFKVYIQLELNMGEVDRCRKLYGKYLEFAPHNCVAWSKYADLEATVGEVERCRSLFELGIEQEVLDKPELLWKAYIDFEISQQEWDKTRALYERLLERTAHVKVFLSFAEFEYSDKVANHDNARDILERAFKQLKEEELKEECVMVLEALLKMEEALPENEERCEEVRKRMPRKIKKKRLIQLEDGSDAGWEEYYDYIFPEDQKNNANLKILEMAKMWKMAAAAKASEAPAENQEDDEDEEDEDDDDDEIDLGDL